MPRFFRVLLCLVLAWISGAALADGYLATDTAIFAGPDSEHALGRLHVAAPVRFIGPERNGWQEVSVSGWSREGAERAIVAAPGIRVPRATLRKDAADLLKFGRAEDHAASGARWRETRITGWIPAMPEPAVDLATLWRRAEPLFAGRCTVCHKRRVPARFTANQWNSLIRIMGPRTGLPEADQALIRVYLQYKSADADALADPRWEAR